MFYKKSAVKIFAKSTGKRMCQSLFFNKVVGLRPVTLLKTRLIAEIFLLILHNFQERLFSQNTSGGCFCISIKYCLSTLEKDDKRLPEIYWLFRLHLEVYLEPIKTSKMQRFAKIVNDFTQNASSQIFNRVLNTPLILKNLSETGYKHCTQK